MKRPTVAVLYLCTGAYQVFWKDFYPNFKELFLPDGCAHDRSRGGARRAPHPAKGPAVALQHHAAL